MENHTVVICLMVLFSTVEMGLGRMILMPVGGKMKVKDVKNNQEVQELGRYSVNQYNLQQHLFEKSNDDSLKGDQLRFKEVVEAEKQVVSGIKYYLTIDAKSATGVHSTFHAMVLVKPWAHSKKLLHFEDTTYSHARE